MSRYRSGARVAAVVLVALAFAATAAGASAQQPPVPGGPSPVPCKSAGGGKYDCSFWPAGNGFSAGAPMQGAKGGVVGYLNQGTNFVTCQQQGPTVPPRCRRRTAITWSCSATPTRRAREARAPAINASGPARRTPTSSHRRCTTS